MCWGTGVTATMVLAGTAGAIVTWRRGDPVAVSFTLGYFALMEALQFAGYLAIDQCGTPANRTITLLSVLHIVFQPIVINAFAMEFVRPGLPARTRRIVFCLSGLASAVMLVQLLPVPQFGTCSPGVALCGAELCTVSGDWHLAWTFPYNGLLVSLEQMIRTSLGFPTYFLGVFLLPLFYGAWRFAVFHGVVGPLLATHLTSNPDEAPAIWCLFSISIIIISLLPPVRRQFEYHRMAAT